MANARTFNLWAIAANGSNKFLGFGDTTPALWDRWKEAEMCREDDNDITVPVRVTIEIMPRKKYKRMPL